MGKQSLRPKSDSSTSKFIDAWMTTVRSLARVRKLSNFKLLSRESQLLAIARQEADNVKELWQAFTTERGQIARYLQDPKRQTVAYLLGFHLPNAYRTQMLLERTNSRFPELKGWAQKSHIVDIGCGTGAMSGALLSWLAERPASLELVDSKPAFLETASSYLKRLEANIKLHTRKADLSLGLAPLAKNLSATSGPVIVLMGYVWNELTYKKSQNAIFELLHALKDRELLLLVLEPANQMLSRSAMKLRDDLLELCGFSPLYPCPGNSPCPMLQRPKDWCYSEATWQRPGLIKKLDQIFEVNHEQIKTSAYAFATQSLRAQLPASKPQHIVVGRPVRADKTGFDYLVCQDTELSKESGHRYPRRHLRGEALPHSKKSESSQDKTP